MKAEREPDEASGIHLAIAERMPATGTDSFGIVRALTGFAP